MELPLFLFILLLKIGSSLSSGGDLDLLLSFKNSLPDPGVLPTWNSTRSTCSFAGVTCRNSRVVAVTINGVAVNADFASVSSFLLPSRAWKPSRCGAVTSPAALRPPPGFRCGGALADLDLSGNRIAGDVSGVALLSSACSLLRSLNLSSNSISSSSSPAAAGGFNLSSLDLSYNQISSGADLRRLLSGGLRYLDLSGNRISGGVPSLNSATSLQHLDLSANDLSGELGGGTLVGCHNLRFLNLSSNHLVGSLPSGLSSCSSLSTLGLANNNFSGDVDFDALTSVPGLRLLDLSYNRFTGALPVNLSTKLPTLELLDLSSNALSGSVPVSLCGNPSFALEELYLQDNFFAGSVPASLSNCSNLVSLDLSFNYLAGALPPSLGSLSKLRDLIMWQNLLEGEIPEELMHLKGLENLILDNNGLTGNIPDGLRNCTELNWISLSSNRLSGPIPPWIGGLGNLAILKLGNNSFSGPIPAELGDCRSLIWLDLNSNRLSGSVPATIAKQSGNIAVGLVTGKRFVYLKNDGSSQCHGSGNLLEFAGIRPEGLNRLPSRRSCNFTRVYMGSTQYTFNNNGSMIFLDLSYNRLEGSIPKEMGRMYYLMILNLGHNALSGSIPPDLGSLRYLAVLDLSHNALDGPIPGSLSGLSMLSEVDLSNNRLNGAIPELGSLATFPRYRYENNSGLCGFPLPACDDKHGADTGGGPRNRKSRKASLAGSVAMGLLFALFCIFGMVIVAVESRRRAEEEDEGERRRPRCLHRQQFALRRRHRQLEADGDQRSTEHQPRHVREAPPEAHLPGPARRHQRLSQRQLGRLRRVRRRLQGPAQGRQRGRHQETDPHQRARRPGVHGRDGDDRKGQASEPGAAAGLLPGRRGAAAGLRVHEVREPRRRAAQREEARSEAKLGGEEEDRGGRGARPGIPPPQLHPPHNPPGHEVEQRPPRREPRGQGVRLRDGQDDERDGHAPERVHARGHAGLRPAGVLPELPVHHQGGRVQLRGRPPGIAHREAADRLGGLRGQQPGGLGEAAHEAQGERRVRPRAREGGPGARAGAARAPQDRLRLPGRQAVAAADDGEGDGHVQGDSGGGHRGLRRLLG
ncbi:brassinosteroid LRR receptor kinase BRI1-like [Iris pallida]|uniref:non-specific serine/threonine protein kinase n=1 Tax=Iris pallida TaxID=29817 RepID=A0AAX6FEC2_IRIPA|nr:brassinosteroid LRR receptor kinase BRI1-like [Iris pallida]